MLIVSGAVAYYLGVSTSRRIHEELSERSQSIAAALGPDDILTLSGTKKDASTTTYKELKAQLAAVKHANPDARSIYLIGQHGGRMFFYVDSEQPDSPDYSSAGEWYDDGTSADKAMFVNGRPLVEGPTTDSYGTFISGLAPIFRPGTHAVLALVGIDVGADTYWRDIVYSAAVPVAVGLSVSMIVIIFEQIRRRNTQLLALRSELVSVASHELRNPITGIRWASESLQKMTNDEKVLRMTKAIYNSAVRLQNSTDDILEITHAMNRRGDLNIVPTDITKLVREILEVQNLSAQQKAVSLELDPSWPAELLVDCDADQMKRALHNVISNAIKYTGSGTAVTVAYKQEDNYHQLLVIDQGIGIPETEQAKVWHGFYRASNAVASKIPGTGLGLFLVRAVMERQGGSARFSSVQNQGTTFILSLPKHR